MTKYFTNAIAVVPIHENQPLARGDLIVGDGARGSFISIVRCSGHHGAVNGVATWIDEFDDGVISLAAAELANDCEVGGRARVNGVRAAVLVIDAVGDALALSWENRS